MPDIVTSKTFVDGEKGITAAKLNQIISGSVIQPAFYSAKPSSATLDPTDVLLELKGTGAYAQITGTQLASSVAGQLALADATQNGMLRQVSGLTTDVVDGTNHCVPIASMPGITLMRLRSLNIIGNPNFEIDQIRCGSLFTFGAAGSQKLIDRWITQINGTLRVSAQQIPVGTTGLTIPNGPNFGITNNAYRITLTTQEAVLGANDYIVLNQAVEAPLVREMANDVTSMSILVRSSVANLTFGLGVRDSNLTHTLVNLCTLGAANTWALLTVPNIPVFPAGGSFPVAPGSQGYTIHICLAAGSSQIASANGSWLNANVIGANGQSNFAAQAVNSTFDIAFVQHEPGPICTTLIDKPFTQNYDECLRCYQKTYSYGTIAGSTTSLGCVSGVALGANWPQISAPFKKPMAKVPTVTGYSTAGVSNNVRDVTAAVDRAISSANFVADSGFAGFQIATTNAANALYQFHYTADTGW